MKSVLVTGASGFVGRHCLNRLISSFSEVHALSRHPLNVEYPSVHWHNIDLVNDEKLSNVLRIVKPTHLLHLAWNVEPKKFWDSLDNAEWVRITENLIRLFVLAGGIRFVGAGSCAEYEISDQYLIEASSKINPITEYGKAKNAVRIYCEKQQCERGLSFSWGRIFYLYGPHENPSRFIPSLIRSLIRKNEFECQGKDCVRDYLYVDDAADAFVRLLLSEVQGPVNVASGYPLQIEMIVKSITDLIGGAERIKWKFLSLSEKNPLKMMADTRRLRLELGWHQQTTLNDGLQKSISYWKKLDQQKKNF